LALSGYMALIRSLIFPVIFHPIGALLVFAAIIGSWFSENGVIWGARKWAQWHRLCARLILGVRGQVEGSLDQGQVLYVIKHESMYEAIDTLALFARPIVVMKSELLAVPAWGYAARKHGSIGVDRDAGSAAMRALIGAARTAKASGRPIVLFPEGTRVAHGGHPPLKAGLAGLYKILDLPVVPIALDAGKIWPRGFIKRAGVIRFKVGDQIPPGLPREEIEARVHAAINALNQ
jgi:1-acyl-sn-glycerol-3-phosphate acyltransferase